MTSSRVLGQIYYFFLLWNIWNLTRIYFDSTQYPLNDYLQTENIFQLGHDLVSHLLSISPGLALVDFQLKPKMVNAEFAFITGSQKCSSNLSWIFWIKLDLLDRNKDRIFFVQSSCFPPNVNDYLIEKELCKWIEKYNHQSKKQFSERYKPIYFISHLKYNSYLFVWHWNLFVWQRLIKIEAYLTGARFARRADWFLSFLGKFDRFYHSRRPSPCKWGTEMVKKWPILKKTGSSIEGMKVFGLNFELDHEYMPLPLSF